MKFTNSFIASLRMISNKRSDHSWSNHCKQLKQQFFILFQIKRNEQQGKLTKSKSKTESVKSMQITADQILKVKLKRVSHNQQENVGNKEKERQLVTLGDLQTVKLRKRPFGDANTPLTDLSNNFQNNIDKRLKFSIEKRFVIVYIHSQFCFDCFHFQGKIS